MAYEAKVLSERGVLCYVIDQRGWGGSTGDYCTFGYEEALDLRACIDVLRAADRIEGALYLAGVSMGASTVVHAAPHVDDLTGIMLVSPLVDLPTAVKAYAQIFFDKVAKYLPDAAYGQFVQMADLQVNGALGKLKALKAAQATSAAGCRALVIRGTNDRFTTTDQVAALVEAGGDQWSLQTIPDRGYITSFTDLLEKTWIQNFFTETQ